MRVFDYIYFKLFSWYTARIGEDYGADWSALLVTVFLIAMNLFTVLWLIEGILQRTVILQRLSGQAGNFVFYVVGVAIGSFIWFKEPRHSIVIGRYSSESARARKLGTVFVVSYIVLTFLVPVVIALTIGRY